jgi:purine-binding chemotaxis protein CheW
MSREFITFEIGDRRLGADVMAIREIRAWSPATPLPNAPSHVRGVVNLRGVVLPVLDLSQRLGWGETEPSGRHVIIVMRVAEQLQGIIVDAVSDIVTLNPSEIQPVPDVGQSAAAAFLEGIATIDGKLIMILGLERITEPQLTLPEAA